MAKSFATVKAEAVVIRDETVTNANTATRVGTAMLDTLDTSEEAINTVSNQKVNISDIVDSLSSVETSKPLSAKQGKVLNDGKVANTRNVIAGNGLTGGGTLSGDVTLNAAATDDSLVVAADGIKVDTVDTLISTSVTKPLSANQGKVLKDELADLELELYGINKELSFTVPGVSILLGKDFYYNANEDLYLTLNGNGVLNSGILYFNNTSSTAYVLNANEEKKFNISSNISQILIYVREPDYIQSGTCTIDATSHSSLDERLSDIVSAGIGDIYFTGIKSPSFVFNDSNKSTKIILPSNCEMRINSIEGKTLYTYIITNEEEYNTSYDTGLFYNKKTGSLYVAYISANNNSDYKESFLIFANVGYRAFCGALGRYAEIHYIDNEPITDSNNALKSGTIGKYINVGAIIGLNDIFVEKQICNLQPNSVYKVKIKNWDVTSVTSSSSSYLFKIMISTDGGTTKTELVAVMTNAQLNNEYIIITPALAANNILCYLGGRCAAYTNGIVHIEYLHEKSYNYNTLVSAYFTGIKKPTFIINSTNTTITFPTNTTLRLRSVNGSNRYEHIFDSTTVSFTISYEQTLYYEPDSDSFVVVISGTNNIKTTNRIALLSYDGLTFAGVLAPFAYDYLISRVSKSYDYIPIAVYFTAIKQPTYSFNGTTGMNITLPANCTMRIHACGVGTQFTYNITDAETYNIAYDQALYYNISNGTLSVVLSNSTPNNNQITLLSYNGGAPTGPLAGYILGNNSRKLASMIPVDLASGDIIDLNFDVKAKLVQANIASNANNQRSQRDKILTLLHFSDIHSSSNSLSRIVNFKNFYNEFFTDVICTGDMVSDKYTDGISWWDNVIGAEKYMMCLGNHDQTIGNPNYMTKNFTQEELYNRYFASRAANWGIEIETNKTYWYKDYDNEKIRIFAYNQFLTDTDDTEQVAWLKTVLQGAITNGYKVVGLIHCTPNNPVAIDCNFTSKAPVLPGYMMNNSALPVIQDFIEGNGDFASNAGEFICWLCGHIHNDYICKSSDYPNQLFLAVPNAYPLSSDADCNRKVGDKSQDCFNIVAFDTYTEVVKIIRVGADRDYLLRHRGTLTINYKTMSVINQD